MQKTKLYNVNVFRQTWRPNFFLLKCDYDVTLFEANFPCFIANNEDIFKTRAVHTEENH